MKLKLIICLMFATFFTSTFLGAKNRVKKIGNNAIRCSDEEMTQEECEVEDFVSHRICLERQVEDAKNSVQAFVDLTIFARLIEAVESAVDLEGSSLEDMLSSQQTESLRELMLEKNIIKNSDEQYDYFKEKQAQLERQLHEAQCSMTER